MKKLLVAHDFSDAADRALAFAHDLARQVGATLDAVYVLPDVYDGRAPEIAGLPPTAPGQTERYLEFMRTELDRRARGVLKDSELQARTHVLRGDPVRHIAALAEEIGADVLCASATGKGAVARALMGSTSQALVRGSALPVIIVP
jgi:nucleotide-binding universal stress UspA family protein